MVKFSRAGNETCWRDVGIFAAFRSCKDRASPSDLLLSQPNYREAGVPDKKLAALVALIILLSLGHGIDHVVRGDFRLQLDTESMPRYAIIVAQYAILGFGLYFYLKNKVGPLFWPIVSRI